MPITVHNNSNQRVTSQGFSPLLRDESPYYNNLNRAPKNAYDYAADINKILSLGGYVTKYMPTIPGTIFSMYQFVVIEDNETISGVPTNSNARIGIVVTSATELGEYWVCSFCPNFIFINAPVNPSPFYSAANQDLLYLANTGVSLSIDLAALTTVSGGGQAIAKKIGPKAIFFCGSARIF